MRVHLQLAGVLIAVCAALAAQAQARQEIAATDFTPVLAPAAAQSKVHLAAYRLDARPVTNREFLAFVRSQPQWRRDRVASLFADEGYLSQWAEAENLGANAQPEQPVTRVSWFAARAYCEANGSRLPNWNEWEWAAAADEHVADARANSAWREQILRWYARPATDALQPVGRARPNLHGIYDLHGLIWEWVEDYSSLMVSNDSRNQGDPDKLEFCGAGSISAQDRENYPVLMRIAFLSALEGRSSARRLGFRCADAQPQRSAVDRPVTMAIVPDALPGDSLYHLPINLETDTGVSIPLSSFRNQPLLITMFYADCSSVCPLLTQQFQNLERRLRPHSRANTHFLMVTLDPARDAPDALSAFRKRHHITSSRWVVARTSPESVRLLAAVLGVRYRQLPDQSFNHSTTIALADRQGMIQARAAGVLANDADLIAAADSM